MTPLNLDSKILISDATLRDGSHAISHQLSTNDVKGYCELIDETGVDWVEVGHGNGLGASSFHIGKSKHSDAELLSVARRSLTKSKLSVHVIPGIASIQRDLIPAIEVGVDVFRIGSHCSEADTTLRHLEFVRKNNKTAVGVLMMSHMISPKNLVAQAKMMEAAGAEAVVIMDSAGAMKMTDVENRILALREEIEIPIGMHAHNNLGLAIGNSVAAISSGARIIDACAAGFGAGAGNAAIEIIVPLVSEMNLTTVDVHKYYRAVDYATNTFVKNRPVVSTTSIATGTAGLFSGFIKPILTESKRHGIDPYYLIEELGKLALVAGQEDVIIETAKRLSTQPHSK